MDDATRGLVVMINLLAKGEGALCKAFYQKYGNEALPVVSGVMNQVGIQWGKIMQQTIPVKSLKPVAEQLKTMGVLMNMGVDIADVSDNELHFKLTACPFGLEGSSRDLCEAAMVADKTRMSIFLGSETDMKILQTVAAGDKQCEVVFSKK